MNKKDNKNFNNSAKCWICDNEYFDGNVKERGHCHFTGKYRGFVHTDCNIKVKSNHKIPAVFHNLKSCDPHLIM